MADSLYASEYPQPLVRPTNLSVPVFSGKVTGRLRLQAIPIQITGTGHAALTTALTGANNDLVFTAVGFGSSGNDITIRYAIPSPETDQTFVSVSGNDIVVGLATNGSGTVISTATQVRTLLSSSLEVSALVTVANAASNSGAGTVVSFGPTALSGGVAPTTGLAVQATVENAGSTSIGVRLRECDSYAADAARTTLATLTLVPGGNQVANIVVSKRYLEVFGTSGNGQVRIQLLSKLRWDTLAFQKTDTTYPIELYQPVSLPAVDGTL